MYMGTVIAMPLTGILAEYVNWEAIFYVFGMDFGRLVGLLIKHFRPDCTAMVPDVVVVC